MASVVTQPPSLQSIWTKRLDFFGIITIWDLALQLPGFPYGIFFGPQTPNFWHCHEHGQLAFGAGRTWLCFCAALRAFESMSFNEVKLITQSRGLPSCSLVRLDKNLQSLSTSEGSKNRQSWPGVPSPSLPPLQVCLHFIQTPRIIWNYSAVS